MHSELLDAMLFVTIKTTSKVNAAGRIVNKDYSVSMDCCVAIRKNKSEL